MRVRITLAALVALCACARRPTTETGEIEPAAAQSVELLVASTTDQHGRVRGWDYYENAPDAGHSLARAATVVDSLRAAAPGRVVLVDAGDLLQGNPLTYVAARVEPGVGGTHPVIAAMNAMRYDAAAVGNHEFNYGLPALERAVGQARFPFLAANVHLPGGARKFAASTILERQGIKVGIVGATTPGSAVWDRDKLEGKLAFRDIVPDVRDAVSDVRARGAVVVVVVVHSGLDEPSSYDTVATRLPSENVAARIAHEVDGIDLIVYGHSHRQMADTTIRSTLLMQPKNWAASVGVAHLTVERLGGRWRVTWKRGELVRTEGHAESPAVLAATQAAHDRTVAYVTSTIGSTSVAWRADSARVADTPLIDLILEVERATAKADLASTAAFSLDASLDAGPITVAEVARLYPYENTLKAVRITGRQLREYLEYSARYFGTYGTAEPAVNPRVPGYNFDIVSGADYTIDLSRPVGSRITRLEVKGRPVRDDDSFTFALNNYRQSGGGGYAMLRDAPVVYEGQTEIRQLLIDDVKRRGTIGPADVFARNWEVVPQAAIAPALRAMRRGFDEASTGRGPTVPNADTAVRVLRIIATNDTHGALEPRPDNNGVRRGGLAYVATVVKRAEAECAARDGCAFLLVDAGDLFQGTPASNLAYGKPVVDVYNALGYAASALGNHEFDWGRDTLRARMRDAHFRILGANVRDTSGADVPWVPDDTLVERRGLKIGIVGLASVITARTTRAVNVAGLRFDDAARIASERAAALRARGAQVVIVLDHDGAFCDRDGATNCRGEVIDIAQGLTGVDLVVSGHTHSLVETRVKGIPVIQARSSGRDVGIVDLALRGSGPDSVRALTIHVVDVLADSVPPDPAIDSIVQRAVAAVAPRVSRVVARIEADMPKEGEQYALGNLLADAQRWAGKADVAVMNNGGIRAPLRQGPATYGDLYEVQPFGNSLHRMVVNGSDLRAYFERLLAARGDARVHVSGVTIAYDPSAPEGQRIRSVTMADRRPLAADRTYSIVMNDFMATGGEGLRLSRTASSDRVLDLLDLDALIAYLESLPGRRVAPPAGDRLVAQP